MQPTRNERCPHCGNGIAVEISTVYFGKDIEGHWMVERAECPSCGRYIVWLVRGDDLPFGQPHSRQSLKNPQPRLVWPRASGRPPCPVEVPAEFANDYREACLVLADSTKASAALSRRCLQHLLEARANVKKGNLADEIGEVLASKTLPSHLAEGIDGIRQIGNLAAHPIKNQSTGEIVDVEPGEAEWNLDVLEGLFDHYFVQPAALAKKRAKLDKKLKDAGKPPMK